MIWVIVHVFARWTFGRTIRHGGLADIEIDVRTNAKLSWMMAPMLRREFDGNWAH